MPLIRIHYSMQKKMHRICIPFLLATTTLLKTFMQSFEAPSGAQVFYQSAWPEIGSKVPLKVKLALSNN